VELYVVADLHQLASDIVRGVHGHV
jgi:hypothetical protein